MTVKELIKKLKKYPGNTEVGFSAHDNTPWEIGGWVSSVVWFEKSEYCPEGLDEYDQKWFDSLPDKVVVLCN